MGRLRKAAVAQLQASFGRDANAPSDLFRISAQEQQFTFDDVVFNAIALLDYVGNAVAFSLYGEPHQKAKWKKAERFARDPDYERRETGANRISSAVIGQAIRDTHRALQSGLVEYRSELLHYQTLPAGGDVRTEFTRNTAGSFEVDIKLKTTAPKAFLKRCPVPGYEAGTIPIEAAGAWVRDETQRRATEILKELERELWREAGRDPDGTDKLIQIL